MNRETFATGEYYHIFNRGVDKRRIVSDVYDAKRFLKSMEYFNSTEPIGSLFQLSFETDKEAKLKNKLVEVIAYCLNPNHYHILLRQLTDRGISEFMKRMNGGYTLYFNHRAKRSGSLFQGKFKAKHIDGNDYLLRLSVYINLNDKVHQLSGPITKLVRSSWEQYNSRQKGICNPSLILQQFNNRKAYVDFATEALPQMLERKELTKDLANLMLE